MPIPFDSPILIKNLFNSGFMTYEKVGMGEVWMAVVESKEGGYGEGIDGRSGIQRSLGWRKNW